MNERFAAASALALPFLVALALLPSPTPAEWAHADPLLRAWPRALTPWLVCAAGAVTAAGWLLSTRVSRPAWRRALAHGALGAVAAVAFALAVRALAGARLPAFVPPEESARPGALLNLAAGGAEEIAFRLWLLPLALVALRRRALACVAVGLAFAVAHLAGGWSTTYFVTRALVPGFAFSVAALVLSPSFVVCAHLAAHLAIPALFS